MINSWSNLVLGVKLPNFYSMSYRIKKYDSNFIINPEDIKNIIEYLDRNGGEIFYG